ncbi:hypothetical protein [Burkholderia cepacia]|uniref:hypothetical protein n=1 Tax=Burkholderia cepacia TaxID=292 RepID=UPI003EDECACC
MNEQAISSEHPSLQDGKTGAFLNWRHHEKVSRFEALVGFLKNRDIEDVMELNAGLSSGEFCDAIQTVNGIGPKTVDYMACLVDIDSIAVDRADVREGNRGRERRLSLPAHRNTETNPGFQLSKKRRRRLYTIQNWHITSSTRRSILR